MTKTEYKAKVRDLTDTCLEWELEDIKENIKYLLDDIKEENDQEQGTKLIMQIGKFEIRLTIIKDEIEKRKEDKELIESFKNNNLNLSADKNIQIGFTVNKKKNTITIKESILDLFSLTVTHHQKRYAENKKAINKTIKNLIGESETEIQGLSGKLSKFLLSCIENAIKK